MDLVPNEGVFYAPDTPVEDILLGQRERGETLESYPLVEKVIEWFDLQITETQKLTNIDVESAVPVESQLIALQELVGLLESKKGDLENLVSHYVKSRKK